MAVQDALEQPADGASATYTFRGRTAAEVMQKVTRTLGKDAWVVSRRQVSKPKFLGVLGGEDELIEIVASPARPTPPEPPRTRTTLLQKTYGGMAREEAEQAAPDPVTAPETESRSLPALPRTEPASIGVAARLEQMERQLRENIDTQLRSFMALQACGGLPAVGAGLLGWYRRLVENDVAPDVARSVVEEVHGQALTGEIDLERALLAALARRIRTSGPVALERGSPTVVAVIGPSGVGKTTLMAKLAVEFAYKRDRHVGVINEDVRRAGAEAQVRNLGQLLGIPVAAAETAQRAREERLRLAEEGVDLLLVDTSGRNPRDGGTLRHLTRYLQAVEPHEVHLVVSAEMSARAALQATQAFTDCGYDRLALGKLDEAPNYGLALTLAAAAQVPLSYLSAGIEYKQPAEPATRERVARLAAGLEMPGRSDLGEPWLAEGDGA